MPLNEEPCRRPNSADGSAWQYGGLSMEGRAFEFGYWCNIFAGSVGSLEFVLEKGYGSLRMSIGFCDTSGATDHTVTFEVIADDKEHLIEPRTIAFGTVADLDIDVTGVTTLRLKISETHPARGTDTPSQPVFAAPTLTPA